ncbi:tetratricopeptide repeat protein [Lentilitoribacter sp. EG35]|uniref:tetratricopeptide repeat protein n=1 Tax=Lentilitoribacter sp. EG35 TaxID=3234192 RepID=UPI00345F6C1C
MKSKIFKTGTEATTALVCASCIFATAPAFATGAAVLLGAAKLYDYYNANKARFGKNSATLQKAVEKALAENRQGFAQRYRENSDIEEELTRIENNFREKLQLCEFEIPHIADAVKNPDGFAATMAGKVLAGLAGVDEEFSEQQNQALPYLFIQSSLESGFKAAVLDPDNFKDIAPEILTDMASTLANIHLVIHEIGQDVKAIRDELERIGVLKSSDLTPEQEFQTLVDQFQLPLNELLGLIAGVLDQHVAPQNFGQMLDVAKAALEKVKTDYQRLSRLSNDVPEIGPFLDKARAALENHQAIDLKQAQTELRAARREYDARTEKRFNEEKENSAQMIVLEAQMAQAQSNVDEAAALYDEAIEKVAHNLPLRRYYLFEKADMLYQFGQYASDPKWLKNSIDGWEVLLNVLPHDDDPDYWARVQVNLGVTLQEFGRRFPDNAILYESISAFRSALTEQRQDKAPQDWAGTLNNLGNSLYVLAERSSDDKLLREAIVAYRAALTKWTQDKVPLQWAMAQNNLGAALQMLGGRLLDKSMLHEAIDAYRLVLTEWTQDKVSLQWAGTQNNIGNVFRTLGAISSNNDLLQEAIKAFCAALTEQTRDKVPLDWAATQYNLGSAYGVLARMSNDEALAEKSIGAFKLALEERREDNALYQHQQTKENLAISERLLADIRAGKAQ